ncbi:MAG: phosphate acyltransferase PlsX [Lachnospiraceae bacterium]|nr:phosphate acyltransferase PlsX [Lachnospiraceae bacterium]
MSEKTIVALDAMGGDNAPLEIVKGAVDAVLASDEIEVLLYGDEEAVNAELSKYKYDNSRLKVVPTTEVISTSEHPVNAITKKKDSSLVRGLKAVKNGEADAFVSAGNSGAILAGGQVLVGRIKGVKRAPFAPIIPTENGPALLLDAGANVDCKPENLVQFAKMGAIYMRPILNREPRVGIVNLGAEEEKGNALVKETFPLLKEEKSINFIGSVESRDIPFGTADVIVCEAFTGNAILKMFEGVAKLFGKLMKKAFLSSIKAKIGALLALPALKKELKKYDTSTYGGAPMLGLRGLVVKTHGSAKAVEVKNSILQCSDFKKQRILETIQEQLGE